MMDLMSSEVPYPALAHVHVNSEQHDYWDKGRACKSLMAAPVLLQELCWLTVTQLTPSHSHLSADFPTFSEPVLRTVGIFWERTVIGCWSRTENNQQAGDASSLVNVLGSFPVSHSQIPEVSSIGFRQPPPVFSSHVRGYVDCRRFKEMQKILFTILMWIISKAFKSLQLQKQIRLSTRRKGKWLPCTAVLKGSSKKIKHIVTKWCSQI